MITTNSTVNLNVGFSALAPGVLGSTGSTTNGVFLEPFVNILQSRSRSNLDRIASANSQSFKTSVDGAGRGAYNFLISGPRADGTGVAINPLQTAFDNDGSRNNNSLSVNTSVLKALGLAPVYTGANLANQIDGTVQFSTGFTFDFNPTNGIDSNAFDFVAIAIHEIGHAIGLDHPGNYNGGNPTYSANAAYVQDSRQYTVMSYFDAEETGARHYDTYAATPLLHDIAAAQALYGANYATRAGNTVYGFNSNADRAQFHIISAAQDAVFAIWDGGGRDTLNLSGYTEGSIINLNAGSFSSAGGLYANIAIGLRLSAIRRRWFERVDVHGLAVHFAKTGYVRLTNNKLS